MLQIFPFTLKTVSTLLTTRTLTSTTANRVLFQIERLKPFLFVFSFILSTQKHIRCMNLVIAIINCPEVQIELFALRCTEKPWHANFAIFFFLTVYIHGANIRWLLEVLFLHEARIQ